MKFKLPSFAELLKMSQQQIDEALAPIRARSAKARATLAMAELDEQILKLESEIQKMALDKEIDFNKMADKLDDIAMLELRKERFTDILASLFPEG